MEKKTGIHFYINIINLDDVTEAEEKNTGEVRHTIHALDTYFSAIDVDCQGKLTHFYTEF